MFMDLQEAISFLKDAGIVDKVQQSNPNTYYVWMNGEYVVMTKNNIIGLAMSYH